MKVLCCVVAMLAMCVGVMAADKPGVPEFQHVFVVVLENQTYDQVIGNTKDMPFLNSLAQRYGIATNYFADAHPSINNYFYLTAGRKGTNALFYKDTADLWPFDVDGPNVASILTKNGKTWKSYAEDLPKVGYVGGNDSPYVKRHDPFAYFATVRDSKKQRQNIVPFAEFQADLQKKKLPDYSFIVPNVYDDAHNDPKTHGTAGCGDSAALKKADGWLQTNIGPLVQSDLFRNSGLLVITFDEACEYGKDADRRFNPKKPGERGGGHVATVIVSSKIPEGTQVNELFHHESVARLTLEALGIHEYPGRAKNAPDMSAFFQQNEKTNSAKNEGQQ